MGPGHQVHGPLTRRLGDDPELEIRETVVQFITILMVDFFIQEKSSAEMVRHDETMSQNISIGTFIRVPMTFHGEISVASDISRTEI